jgi:8-oxo-dGTP pyrophosphatase MutT (NUDIX family)
MENRLKELLAARRKRYIDEPERVRAAVLVPLYRERGQYHIVFIKRTDDVETHKGQISFPGGRMEKRDKTLLDTALREAFEEIGLHPQEAKILGELDDEVTTTSNYIVTPFVALIPWPYHLVMSRHEVAEIIRAPVAALLDKANIKPATETLEGGIVLDSYDYYYDGRVIWGATARILHKFLDIFKSAWPEAR